LPRSAPDEKNCKVPKEKTTMRFGESIYSRTKSAGYPGRETLCSWMTVGISKCSGTIYRNVC